jgi:hypothetical protein
MMLKVGAWCALVAQGWPTLSRSPTRFPDVARSNPAPVAGLLEKVKSMPSVAVKLWDDADNNNTETPNQDAGPYYISDVR